MDSLYGKKVIKVLLSGNGEQWCLKGGEKRGMLYEFLYVSMLRGLPGHRIWRQGMANILSWRDKAQSLGGKSCLEFTYPKGCRGESCTKENPEIWAHLFVSLAEWWWVNRGEETTQGHEKIHLSGLKMTVHGRDIGLVKPLFSPVRDWKTSQFIRHQVALTEESSSIIGYYWSKTLLQPHLTNCKRNNKQYPSKLIVTQNKAQEYLWQYKNIQHLAKWSSQCWNSIKSDWTK